VRATDSGIQGASFLVADVVPATNARDHISSRTSPGKVLDDFQKSGQSDRAHSTTDSDAQDRQPEARGPGLQEGRGYLGIVGLGHMI